MVKKIAKKKTRKVVKVRVKVKTKAKRTASRAKTPRRPTVQVTVTPGATVNVTVGPEKPRDTIVSFLLDESGSMQSCLNPTISGFNEYVNGLRRNKTGKVDFTFTKFEGENVRIVHTAVPLSQVVPLTYENYRPGGGTPLYDAIGRTIRSLEATLAGRTDKPAVLFVIMTDGQENQSREYTRDAVNALIKQKTAEGWDFVYLGANHDAYGASQTIGLSAGNTVHYGAQNTVDVFVNLAHNHTSYVTANAVGKGSSICRSAMFSAEEKTLMEKDADLGITGQSVLSSTK